MNWLYWSIKDVSFGPNLGPALHTAMYLKNAKSVIMSYKIFIDNLHVDATFHIVSDQPTNKGLDV